MWPQVAAGIIGAFAGVGVLGFAALVVGVLDWMAES